MSDFITFSTSMLPSTARVLGFRGFEAISRLYQFDVFVSVPSDDADFELVEAVGTKGSLMLGGADGAPAVFAGILGGIELVHEFGGSAILRAVLVPRLSELANSMHSRIFTRQSVPQVIGAVLADNGVDVELRLGGAYEAEEHICQYRESDSAFISRWMEREGIFYYFEHEEGGEKLVLSDSAAYPVEPLGRPVRYAAALEQDWSSGSAFRSFSGRATSVAASVKLRDYNYLQPSVPLSGAAPVSPNGLGEVNLYGERFFTPAAGQRLARIRAEELLARQSIFHAVGSRTHLCSGVTFELEEHPRASFNARYLVIEAHHRGNQGADEAPLRKLLDLENDGLYVVDLTAIPAKTQFRAASVTPWPRIYGYENAVIDAAGASDYAQIDSQGRYNVKFHFDESSLKGGTASTWVRMMQPHGGSVEGFHFPLRKGVEVVVSFLGGDPDRPVISGVVSNAVTPSPVTAGNFTKNVIQTGGRNRLELEDLAGQERITMSTPHTNSYVRMGAPNADHTMIIHTDGPTLIDAGLDLDITAGGHKHETITGEVTETYGNTKSETVTGAVTEMFKATKDETVMLDLSQHYKAKKLEEATGAVTLAYSSTKDETVTGALTETYKSTKSETVTGAVTEKYDGGQTITITGDKNETISGAYNLKINSDAQVVIAGAVTKKVHGPYFKHLEDENRSIYGGVRSSTFYGADNGNNFGIANYNKFGAAIYTTIGGMLDLVVGPKIIFQEGFNVFHTAGSVIDVNIAVKLNETPVAITAEQVKLELGGLKSQLRDLYVGINGLNVVV